MIDGIMVHLFQSLVSFCGIFLPWLGDKEAESEGKGTGYFHLNTGNVFVLNFAAGFAFGGQKLMGNTCL